MNQNGPNQNSLNQNGFNQNGPCPERPLSWTTNKVLKSSMPAKQKDRRRKKNSTKKNNHPQHQPPKKTLKQWPKTTTNHFSIVGKGLHTKQTLVQLSQSICPQASKRNEQLRCNMYLQIHPIQWSKTTGHVSSPWGQLLCLQYTHLVQIAYLT